MQRFKYRVEKFQDSFAENTEGKMVPNLAEDQFEAMLPTLGDAGWDLVSIISNKNISGFTAVFKQQGALISLKKLSVSDAKVSAALLGQSETVENLVVGPANPSGDPTHTCVSHGGACEICGE